MIFYLFLFHHSLYFVNINYPRLLRGSSLYSSSLFHFFRIGTWYSPFIPLMAIIKLPIIFYAMKVKVNALVNS